MRQKRLLIATDGSPPSAAAVEAGVELAAEMHASVLFVHATSPLAEDLYAAYPEEGPPLDEILARDAVLAAAVGQAEKRGVDSDVRLVAEEGGSAELAAEVSGIAAGLDASMIVTGSRGRGAVAGAVLGSVSHNLIKYATVPVLVVHGPADDEPGGK